MSRRPWNRWPTRNRPRSWSTFSCGAPSGACRFDLVSDRNSLSEFAERQAAFRAWCAERERFARRHGWTGGEDVRRREEVHTEPFDLSAI